MDGCAILLPRRQAIAQARKRTEQYCSSTAVLSRGRRATNSSRVSKIEQRSGVGSSMLPVTAFVPAAIAREPMSDKSGWLYSEPEALTANSKPWSKAMRRHQFNDNTILEERLVDLARRV